ncbi:FecR family protein [Flavilitoribacter nigricans]|uniref:Uncharacterized protein n=1 Tax=Flavilitoribacter nigricans (strain ATCC 23147 / DSM 23189 / NBRC 102662 / NCIMB 1420 / SS-2) TaxID=1122177 RepID=A0A2D0NH33_FLAN2|nr:FecR domain-containing protein [Flavilitoribacter nigricans]PHN07696.1 hypothetical protein CRP01_06240 [Flavilitoribacter nigricans DSM 23189 = NBRC 102662]
MKRKKIDNLEDLLGEPSFREWVSGEREDQQPFWEQWIRETPQNRQLAEQAISILKGIPFEIREVPLEPAMIREEWHKLHAKTSTSSPGEVPGPDSRRLRVHTWGLRIAAGFALLILSGFLLEYFVLNPYVDHHTAFGQQMTIILPDSTLVKLNANSTLSYRKQRPRKVWLDGEAFFQVKKKPETGANFRVLTNDLTVEVLGTAFNVIEKKDKTEVVLEEGSVKLNLNRDFESELLMKPGDLVSFSVQDEQDPILSQVKAEKVTSWKDGVLEFEDVPLTELMDRIQAIYGWQAVYYDESLKERKISLGLPAEDLESALLILSKTMGMKIEKVEGEDKVLLLR